MKKKIIIEYEQVQEYRGYVRLVNKKGDVFTLISEELMTFLDGAEEFKNLNIGKMEIFEELKCIDDSINNTVESLRNEIERLKQFTGLDQFN